MKAPYTKFGQTRMVPVTTYTRGREDRRPRASWDETLWIERPEDSYALLSSELRLKVVRVVSREAWLAAAPTPDEKGGGR